MAAQTNSTGTIRAVLTPRASPPPDPTNSLLFILTNQDHHEISRKINAVVAQTDAPQKSCEDFTLDELNQLMRDMSW